MKLMNKNWTTGDNIIGVNIMDTVINKHRAHIIEFVKHHTKVELVQRVSCIYNTSKDQELSQLTP
jgi:hypothetical protein